MAAQKYTGHFSNGCARAMCCNRGCKLAGPSALLRNKSQFLAHYILPYDYMSPVALGNIGLFFQSKNIWSEQPVHVTSSHTVSNVLCTHSCLPQCCLIIQKLAWRMSDVPWWQAVTKQEVSVCAMPDTPAWAHSPTQTKKPAWRPAIQVSPHRPTHRCRHTHMNTEWVIGE